MKISYRRVTSGSALSVAMAFVLMVQGCAPTLVQMDKQDLVRLKDQGVIQAVHYDPPSKPDRSECAEKGNAYDKLLRTPFFGGVLFSIPALADIEHCFKRASEQYLDGSTLVKERFVAEASRNLGLQNVRKIPDTLPNDELDSLKQRFGAAMVLDFKVTDWEPLVISPRVWGSVTRYRLPAFLRARLIRLSDSKILWQDGCNFDALVMKTSAEAQGSLSSYNEVWGNVTRHAETCADDLVARFASQEARAK